MLEDKILYCYNNSVACRFFKFIGLRTPDWWINMEGKSEDGAIRSMNFGYHQKLHVADLHEWVH